MSSVILRRRGLGHVSCRGIAEASLSGIEVVRSQMRGCVAPIPPDAQMVFRWGCTATIPHDPKVINNAGAIRAVSDKAGFRYQLNIAGLCPETWFKANETPGDRINNGVIVRPAAHAQGKNLWLCHTTEAFLEAVAEAGDGYYISCYIPKVAEYRVYVVQGRCISVDEKTPDDPSAIAWNHAQGGHFKNVKWGQWPINAIKTSLDAFALSGLHFGGVDVIVDADGKAYVLEINSAPSVSSPYKQQCFAAAFDWIVEEGDETIPEVDNKGWRGMIHPAISEEAI